MRRPWGEPDQSVWGKARGLDLELAPYPLVRHLLDAAAAAEWQVLAAESARLTGSCPARCNNNASGGVGAVSPLTRAKEAVGVDSGVAVEEAPAERSLPRGQAPGWR